MVGNVKMFIYGNLSYDESVTPSGATTTVGGAAYYGAVGASLFTKNLGIVSAVGEDYDFSALRRLRINLDGVNELRGKTAKFHFSYSKHLQMRSFTEELNVAKRLSPESIPNHYLSTAKYIHIATNPPESQLKAIKRIKSSGSRALISIDSILDYIIKDAGKVREAFGLSDIVFLDKQEEDILHYSQKSQNAVVLKLGKNGATYIEKNKRSHIDAPKVKIIDKTGSGDLLAGAFVAQLAEDYEIEAALHNAVIAASAKIAKTGAEHLLYNKTLKFELRTRTIN